MSPKGKPKPITGTFDYPASPNESEKIYAKLQSSKETMFHKFKESVTFTRGLSVKFESYMTLSQNRLFSILKRKLKDQANDAKYLTGLLQSVQELAKANQLEDILDVLPGNIDESNALELFKDQKVRRATLYILHSLYLKALFEMLTSTVQLSVKASEAKLFSQALESFKSSGKISLDPFKQATKPDEAKENEANKNSSQKEDQEESKSSVHSKESAQSVSQHVVDHDCFVRMTKLIEVFLESVTLESDKAILGVRDSKRVQPSSSSTPKAKAKAKGSILSSSILDKGILKLTSILDTSKQEQFTKAQAKRALNRLKVPAATVPSLGSPLKSLAPDQGMYLRGTVLPGSLSGNLRPTKLEVFLTQATTIPDFRIKQGKGFLTIKSIYAVLGYLGSKRSTQHMILPLAAYTKQLPHSPQMHKHISILYGKGTADLVVKMLRSSMYRDQMEAMSNLSAHMMEQQRFEEFQSGAANQATEGSTLFHLATLFTSGFTSFNAFLQLFTSIIEAKQTKKIGNLVQALVDFWFFNKLFNISFQKITGVNLGAHAEGMVEKMIAEVFRKAQIADLLQNDNALAKSCLSGFYQSYAHIKFKQGSKKISLFESNEFIDFARNLFVEDNGRVINPKSSAHPKLTQEHINGQADKKLNDPLKTAVKKLVTALETDHSHRPYAMTPFFFFSVALRSGKVSTSQELSERINLKDE